MELFVLPLTRETLSFTVSAISEKLSSVSKVVRRIIYSCYVIITLRKLVKPPMDFDAYAHKYVVAQHVLLSAFYIHVTLAYPQLMHVRDEYRYDSTS